MENNNGLSIIDSLSLDQIKTTMTKINNFHEIIRQTLILDIDYGLIPGAKKPSLYKSGAENIIMLFGLSTSVKVLQVIPESFDKDTDFISYTIKSCLLKNGEVISEGIGTCNTKERKYRNNETHDICNTILKMASKRAMVDAVLHIASLSAVFAQEIDDLTDYNNRETFENMSVNEASQYQIKFGKHKGKTAGEVYKNHFDYVKWFNTSGTDKNLLKVFNILSEAVKNQKSDKVEVELTQVSEDNEEYELDDEK